MYFYYFLYKNVKNPTPKTLNLSKMLHLKLGSEQFVKIPTPKISKFLTCSPYWVSR